MIAAGRIEKLSRGLYRLTDRAEPSQPDLLIVASRQPRAVLCLISALSFHGLTDEIPREIHVALPRGAEQPRISHPPLRVYRLKPASFEAGIEVHKIEGIDMRIYSPAKSVADAFQFRAAIGIDVALAALKAWMKHAAFSTDELLAFARICRVERLVKAYVEALL